MKHVFKFLLVFISIITFAIVIVGCSKINKDENYNSESTDFTFTVISSGIISSGSRLSIYRDNKTNVMYVSWESGYAGGLTVMLDEDGTPLIYDEWKEK